MKEYVWGVWFEGNFIFNLRITERSHALAFIEALKTIEKRYPVKWRGIVLKAPNDAYIEPHEEPSGTMVRMLAEN